MVPRGGTPTVRPWASVAIALVLSIPAAVAVGPREAHPPAAFPPTPLVPGDEKAAQDPKVSSHVSRDLRQDAAAEARLAVRASDGVTGEALARSLAASGFHTEAHGRRAVQVRAPLAVVPMLAAREDVAFVHYPAPVVPMLTTEGVAAMRADLAHAVERGGAGVKVAVIDLGFEPTHPEIRDRVRGNVTFDGSAIDAGSTEHGTACAEIILDVAPEAELYLLRVSTAIEWEAALLWTVENGMDVASASLGVVDGPLDGTSDLSETVTWAVSEGVLVVVSAGNMAHDHWAGPWADEDTNGWLEFAPGDEALALEVAEGDLLEVLLFWDDYPASDQDYDLFLVNAWGDVLEWSEDVQSGSQPPSERLSYQADAAGTLYLLVLKYRADGTSAFHLFVQGATLTEHVVPAGSITIPADAIGALSIGAADFTWPHAPHGYSSQGPTDDGRVAPLFSSAAGVTTAAYGGAPFFGTSAAAPHVAGALALMLEEDPSLTFADAVALLALGSRDTGDAGLDLATGFGWVDAYDALAWTDVTPPGLLDATADEPYLVTGGFNLTLGFTDHLSAGASDASVSIVPETGAAIPLTTTTVGGRTWTGRGVVPADVDNGPVTLDVRGIPDWAENVMPNTTVGVGLILDTRPPNLVAVEPEGGSVTRETQPVLRASLSDDGAGVDASTVTLHVGTEPLATSYDAESGFFVAAVPSALSAGVHTARVEAADLAGFALDATWSFEVDPTAPVLQDVALDVPTFSPNGDGARDEATVMFTTLDPALVTLEVLNATDAVVRAWSVGEVAADETRALAWNGTNDAGETVEDGSYSLLLRAMDDVGNVAEWRLPVVVDTLAPAAVAFVDASPLAGGRIRAEWSTVVDAADYLVSLGEGVPVVTNGTTLELATPVDAWWDVQVAARDAAHNVGPAVVGSVLSDRVGPEVVLAPVEPNGENGWNLTAPVLQLASVEEGVTFSYRYGDDAWSTTSDGLVPARPGGLWLSWRGTDAAGNLGEASEARVLFDADAPTVTGVVSDVASGPDPTWFREVATITGTAVDATSGVAGVERWDPVAETWMPDEGHVLNEDGRVGLTYRARDIAGQWGDASTFEVGLDRAPPDVRLSLDPLGVETHAGWYSGPVRLLASWADALSGIDSVVLTRTVAGTTAEVPPAEATEVAEEGVTEWTLRATDAAGNVAEATRTIRIDTSAPIVRRTTPELSLSTRFTVAVQVEDAGSGVDPESLRLVLPQVGEWAMTLDGEWARAEIPHVSPGFKRFTVTGTDNVGRAFAHAFVVQVLVPQPPAPPSGPVAGAPPVVTLEMEASSARVGVPLSGVIRVSDPEGGSVAVTLELGEGEAQHHALAPGRELRFTHVYTTPGEHLVRATARDAEWMVGASSATALVTAAPATLPLQLRTEDGRAFDAASAVDPGTVLVADALLPMPLRPLLTVGWDVDGDGAEDVAGETARVVASGRGARVLHATARDAWGAQGATLSFVVRNVPPQLDATSDGRRFFATVTDANGDPVQVTWSFGDGQTFLGLEVERALPPGEHRVVLVAHDGELETRRELTVLVDAPPDLPRPPTPPAPDGPSAEAPPVLPLEQSARDEPSGLVPGAVAEGDEPALEVPAAGASLLLGAIGVAALARRRRGEE